MKNIKFLVFGTFFGIVLTKGEVISWFRIQEMFRFESIHMYGIIGSALLVAMVSIFIMKAMKAKAANGEEINYPYKPYSKSAIFGGTIFGFGWALTGACPGPIFALVGDGYTVFAVTLLSAIFGAWLYGLWREKLPH